MANYASITLTPVSLTTIGQFLGIGVTYTGGSVNMNESCQTTRNSPGTFTQGATLSAHVTNAINALSADYNSYFSKFYVTALPGNTGLKVIALEYGITFVNNSAANWNAVIVPEVVPTPVFEINAITAAQASTGDKNTTCRFNVTFNNYSTGDINQTSPIAATYPNATGIGFNYQRYPIPQATVSFNNNSVVTSRLLPRVTVWNVPTVELVAESLYSFTVKLAATRQYTGEIDTTLLYSIDGSNYQSSPNFPGIVAGNYTAYIIDSLGGLWTSDFEVVELTNQPEPYFNISRLNSIHFSDVSKAGVNFWSRFEDQKFIGIEFQNFAQDFKPSDTKVTQINTSYRNITATLRTYCEKEVIGSYDVVKKIDNIQILDKRDCQVLSYGDGVAYIYFPSGTIYEPGTLTPIGSYQLFQDGMCRLETWMKAGITVLLSTSVDYYEVQSIEYIEDIGYAMKIDAVFAAGTYYPQCESLYNKEPFDVFEFIADFSTLNNGMYEIVVNATDSDPRYLDIEWISEPIQISDCRNTVEVTCFTTSRYIIDINPTTGITHGIRVPGRIFDFNGSGESETFDTDNGSSVLLKRTSSLVFNLETDPIPAYLIDKLNNYAGHDNYFIDGVNYCALESSQIESLAKDRNPFIKYTQQVKYNDTGVSTPSTGIITGSVGNVLGVGNNTVLGV